MTAKELPKDADIPKDYQYVGSVSEAEIPKLKSKYFYLKTGQNKPDDDMVNMIFGSNPNQPRSVYVYKKKVE